MKKNFLTGASLALTLAITSPSTVAWGSSLNCARHAAIVSQLGEDTSFFIEQTYTGTDALRDAQIRKAVGAFYYGVSTAGMTMAQLDDLGEGVYVDTMLGADGVVYDVANVGFGGGNSAQYLFATGTTNLARVMLQDGDCVDVGSAPEFPHQRRLQNTLWKTQTCTLASGEGPWARIQISYETFNGMAVSNRVAVRTEWNQGYRNYTTDMRPTRKTTRTLNMSGSWVSVGLGEFAAGLNHSGSLRLALNPDGSVQSAESVVRVYGERYWDDAAFDLNSTWTCNAAPFTAVHYFLNGQEP